MFYPPVPSLRVRLNGEIRLKIRLSDPDNVVKRMYDDFGGKSRFLLPSPALSYE